MIAYVTIGSNNVAETSKFYDELLSVVGAQRTLEMENMVAWGTAMNAPMVSIIKPHDGNEASVGNGMMVSLAAGKPDLVDQLHAKAMELGAADEGAPGPRGGGTYIGYFRDPEGNKLAAFALQDQG